MPLELGAAFRPREVVVVEPEPDQPSIEDLRAEQLLVALSNLQDALNSMPAPVVNVAEPDLTAIVNAVTQLNGPATAQEIAQAVREVIDPSPQPTIEPVLAELTAALKTLDFRMKGIGGSSGVGVSDINDRATRVLGQVAVTGSLPPGTNTIGHVRIDLDAETLLLLPSAARTTSEATPAFDTSSKSRIAVDVNVTEVSGTLSPSLRLFVERLGADGVWYSIYTSNAITGPTTVSTTIGQGMTVGQSLAAMCRMRWEITGTSPSATFSVSVVGK